MRAESIYTQRGKSHTWHSWVSVDRDLIHFMLCRLKDTFHLFTGLSDYKTRQTKIQRSFFQIPTDISSKFKNVSLSL